MRFNELVEKLAAQLLLASGVPVPASVDHLGKEDRERFERLGNAREIIVQLLREAYAHGFPENLSIEDVGAEDLLGGMTAAAVLRLKSEIACVVKMDVTSKLAGEARKLIRIRDRDYIPAPYAQCFPTIYASKLDTPPYVYLMENFPPSLYTKLSQWVLTAKPGAMTQTIDRILAVLIGTWEATVDRSIQPNIEGIYLDRIATRLQAAAQLNRTVANVLKSGAIVNGERYDKPEQYVSLIRQNLSVLRVGFVTFVHGDPHPGNVLVANDGAAVKFIDVKDWYFGDYIWDIGKLLHYLGVTGPVEDQPNNLRRLTVSNGAPPRISYKFTVAKTVRKAMAQIEMSTETLANKLQDTTWRKRLDLAIASNLLGLPEGRLKKNKEDYALVLLGEGLRWLATAASA